MGYYVDGSGSITFDKVLDEEEVCLIRNALKNAWFEWDFIIDTSKPSGNTMIGIWRYDAKYYDREMNELLGALKKIANVSSGYIKFIGEDGDIWRFLFRNGEWVKQKGVVVYEDIDG